MRYASSAGSALAVGLVVSTLAHASVVIGNLGADGSGGLGTNTTTISGSFGFGFRTGTDPGFLQLSSAVFGLATNGNDSVTATLYQSDTPSGSGTFIATQSVTTTAAKITFVPAEPLPLLPETQYVISLERATAGELSWVSSDPFTTQQAYNSSDWSLPDTLVSFDGVEWERSGPTGQSVSISAVPEPSACILGGVGLVAAWLLRRSGKC